MAGRKPRADVKAAVESLLAAQVRPGQIATTLAVKFSLSERQIHRYIRRIQEELAEEAEKERPLRKNQLRQSLRAILQKALQTNQLTAAVQAADRLAKLDGLFAPERIEATLRTVELMTSDQQRKRLFELAAKAGMNGRGNGHDHDPDMVN